MSIVRGPVGIFEPLAVHRSARQPPAAPPPAWPRQHVANAPLTIRRTLPPEPLPADRTHGRPGQNGLSRMKLRLPRVSARDHRRGGCR